jgi:hypothetical protein
MPHYDPDAISNFLAYEKLNDHISSTAEPTGWHLTHKNLESLKRENPAFHKIYVQLAYLEHHLAITPESDPSYQSALKKALELRPVVRGF